MMRIVTLSMAVVLSMLFAGQAAEGAHVGFESPTYSTTFAGTPVGTVVGQNGWAVSSASGSGTPDNAAGNIQDAIAHGGSQALATRRSTDGNSSRFTKSDFTSLSDDGNSIEWWARRDGTLQALYYIGTGNEPGDAAVNVGWNNSNSIIYRDGGGFTTLPATTVADVWYGFSATIDFTNQQYDLTIQSEGLATTDPGYVNASLPGLGFRNTGISAISAFMVQTGTATGPTLYTDDINFIPEPTSLCLVGLGLAGLLGYGRRRRG